MKALLIVDVQNEWFDEDSEYYVGDHQETLININKLITHCRKKGFKIIFIRHVEKEGDAFTGKNADIISFIDKNNSDTIITKHKISPYYKTTLEKELQRIDSIIISGMLTNLCVRSTASDAYDRDIKVRIIADCCIAMDKKTHDFTIKDLRETRPEINVCNVDNLIGE